LVGAAVWTQLASVDKKEEPVVLVPIDNIRISADEYTKDNDVDGGLAFYDEEINKRENNEEKKQLLLYKSDFARNAGRPSEALDAAKKADQITSDTATTQALAEASEAAGNKEEAIAYYRKMIETVENSGDEMAASYTILWEAKVKELEQ
jgi:tetratricopeptide (TPR) repeat protein